MLDFYQLTRWSIYPTYSVPFYSQEYITTTIIG